ncbi:MAG: hypothetical protein KF822_04135, partial [Steroidobacteraceae bacterium]|nr:hypothetical protein [Steroidobacteraceae bacterium]
VGGTVGGVAGAAGRTTAGIGGTVGGAAGAAARSTGAVGGLDLAGGLQSGSRGVFGMRDLELTGAAQGDAQGSVISSAQRNVRLESGTQMLIVAGARSAERTAESAEDAPPADPPAREVRDDRR